MSNFQLLEGVAAETQLCVGENMIFFIVVVIRV